MGLILWGEKLIGSIKDFQEVRLSKGLATELEEVSLEVKTDAIIEMLSKGILLSHHLHHLLLLSLQKVNRVVILLATHLQTQMRKGSQK